MTAEDEDETLEGTLEDKELTIDGLDSKFEWIDESVDYPIEEEEEEEVEEDVDTDEDYYYSDESDESEDDEPMSFWYGDYESIDGESTISIEYSIIDYAVDYDFSIPTGYMSGTWQAADESALDVLYDSTLIITYEDDGTLYIEARNSDVEEAYTGYFYPVE